LHENPKDFQWLIYCCNSLMSTSLFNRTDITSPPVFFQAISPEKLIIPRLPLFNIWPDSRIAFAGPWLIRMNAAMEMREQLEALEAALPGVSWIVSGSTPEEQVAHLRRYMNVGLPDGQAALLRFQDPRVQVRLGATLNSQQHREMTDLMREWLTVVDGKVWSFMQRDFVC